MGLPPEGYIDDHSLHSVGPITDSTGRCLKPSSFIAEDGTLVLTMLPAECPVDPGEQSGNSGGDRSTASRKTINVEADKKAEAKIPKGHELLDTCSTRFVHSSFFQNATLFVIVLNGLWIGIDVQWNHPNLVKNGKAPLEPVSIVVENGFCVYFTFEIVTRIVAFGKHNVTDNKLNRWFIFDSVLVTFMVVETWILLIVEALTGGGGGGILSKFSCLRLLRLSRLTRLMHSLPELLTLVRGMINAARAVGVVLMFMILLMYIFAIVFTSQLGDPGAPEHLEADPYWVRDSDPTAQELFSDMGSSMMTLFTRGLLGDNLAETLQAIKDRAGEYSCEDGECTRKGGPLWLMWVFIVFMIMSAFCILNMLVGVLCEVIEETAREEEEASSQQELSNNIRDCFVLFDETGDNEITKKEWANMKGNDKVRGSMLKLGVDERRMDESLDQMEEHLFGGLDMNRILESQDDWVPQGCIRMSRRSAEAREIGIPLEDFVDQLLNIRPDGSASFLDLEILAERARRDELVYTRQCDNIEKMLLSTRTDAKQCFDGHSLAVAQQEAARKQQEAARTSPSPLPVSADDQTAIKENGAEEPNNGTSASANSWLMGMSSDVLFAELKHRASLQDNSSVPALLD